VPSSKKPADRKSSGKSSSGKGKDATKGTAPRRPPSKGSRYTPPKPKKATSSGLWVPVSMFTCLVLGVAVIAGNYMQLLPGGEVSNNFLLIGLVLLVAGFVLSTFFR
jgi:Cell division protein CrgA